MPKTKISEFDTNPDNNTDINSINIAEGCAPSGINNAIRQLMADLKEFQTGAGGDPFNGAVNGTVGATTPNTGAFTSLSASGTVSGTGFSNYLASPPAIGGSTAAAGTFTSLTATGAFAANGGATLGDASGDALTINSSAVSIPNGLNFDSNTFVIDATNNWVFVGKTASGVGTDGVQLRAGSYSGFSSSGSTALFVNRNTDDGTLVELGRNGTAAATLGISSSALTIGTGGSERMRITNTGNVGIGTSSPAYRLDVAASNPTRGIISRLINTATSSQTGSQLEFFQDGIDYWSVGQPAGVSAFVFWSGRTSSADGTERMRITNTGNVGIGTSSPSAKLDVLGSKDATNLTVGAPLSTVGGGAFANYSELLFKNTAGSNSDASIRAYGNVWDSAGSQLAFFTSNNSAVTERMRIDSSGNVGIGTSSPGVALDIGRDTSINQIKMKASNGNVDLRINSAFGAADLAAIGVVGGYPLMFFTSNSERMRIDSSGNVGIGTSSPTDTNAWGRCLDIRGTSTSGYAGTYFGNSDATVRGYVGAGGSSGSGFAFLGTSTSHPLAFYTVNTERMRIDSSGRVLCNETNGATTNAILQTVATTGTNGLSVRSPASFGNSQILSGSATAAGTGWFHFTGQSNSFTVNNILIYGNGNVQNANNSYGAISDIKLKENIVDATPKLEKLCNVRIVNYNLKGNYEQHKQIGVIAQELEQIFPSMVDESPDRDSEGNDLGTTTKSVKYSVFVPMLIKAVQELKAELDTVKAELNTLKGN